MGAGIMVISEKEIEHLSRLARIELKEPEKEKLLRDLNRVLEYFQKLQEVDTHDVQPLSHPLQTVNVFRADEVKESLPVEQALQNAPTRKGPYFTVPKVIK